MAFFCSTAGMVRQDRADSWVPPSLPSLPAADGGRWVGGDDGGCSEAEVVHRSFVQQLLF